MSASSAQDRSRSSAGIADQLDRLYVSVRGAPYANSLNLAKAAFQANDYAEALRLVRGASEIFRRSHLQTLQQDPAQAPGGKTEVQKLRDKQAKIKAVADGFDLLLERLERLAKLKAAPSPPTPSVKPQLPPKPTPGAGPSGETTGGGAKKGEEPKPGTLVSTIDMGSFTQLQTAAQQTGLVPNADAIGFVREHEFRMGKYQEAFDRIETVFQQARTAAEQRVQRLRREDFEHRSGALKMSPKDWALKVQRDTAQTQLIDRALRYFLRVLDGLRILVASSKQ